MSRTPFDQFSKQYLEELLTPLGQVQTHQEVPGESRFVDVWFSPFSQPAIQPESLGLLGKIATTACLIEPFRHQPTLTEIRNCLLKLFLIQAEQKRQAKREAKREGNRLDEAELPRLWILTTSASENLLQEFGAKADQTWLPGVYFLATALRSAIVALNQLPAIEETRWLRILGKGRTQQQAIDEVLALSPDNPYRSQILRLLATWKIKIETSFELDQEDQELLMELSKAYLEWENLTKQAGLQQGLQQGIKLERRTTLENIFKLRFGQIDDPLNSIIQRLVNLTSEEYSLQMPLLLSLSREDLLERFSKLPATEMNQG